MTKEFLIRFDAKLIIDGQIQIKANSEEEAENLAEMILQETLNCEDCIIELENNITIKEMEVLGTFNGVNVTEATFLN